MEKDLTASLMSSLRDSYMNFGIIDSMTLTNQNSTQINNDNKECNVREYFDEFLTRNGIDICIKFVKKYYTEHVLIPTKYYNGPSDRDDPL